MNDKMSRYNKQMGTHKFLYENLQLGVAKPWVSLREPLARHGQPMGFLTRNLKLLTGGKVFPDWEHMFIGS